jgi:aromatic ring-opening dioxygenase catalytic subunit (LigB family)
MYYFNSGARRRVLSIGVCQIASVDHDLEFGAALGDAIRGSGRRVVLIASCGMSHRFWDYDTVLSHASASPDDISSTANRLYDERIMRWFAEGLHADVIDSAADFRAHCSPEGRFSHYLIMAGAMGARRWTWRGEQFGRYESAIGTGQAIFYFAPDSNRAPRGGGAGGAA